MNLKETELKLIEKIKQSQERLKRLRQKRKLDIGELAIKYHLDDYDNVTLETFFKEITEKNPHGHPVSH